MTASTEPSNALHAEADALLEAGLRAVLADEDHRAGVDTSVPPGLYWGVYLGDERRGPWKLDVWLTEPAHLERAHREVAQLRARLSPTSRDAVLAIKGAVRHHPEYRHSFSSQDVYAAVLDHGVTDLAGFWKFVRDRGVAGAP